MDRYDEKDAKKDRTDEVEPAEPARQGDVLGLSGAAVPKMPGDPTADQDEASVAKRRARARGGDPEPETGPGQDYEGGAAGIDMGTGGQGTSFRGK